MIKPRTILGLLLVCLSVKGQNMISLQGPRLSPLTRKFMAEWTPDTLKIPQGYVYKNPNGNCIYVSALVKVADSSQARVACDLIGARIGTKAGNIWTVQVPYAKVGEFTKIRGLAYIQLDEPVKPCLDIARKTTRVDSVHKGIKLPMKYSGKGVVIGIIDFGFDYNHPALYDTAHNDYRVKRVWELNTKGTPPTGYTYGHEMKDGAVIRAQGTDNPAQTHGTMVAGMAAGSGYGSSGDNTRFRGMAYEADLVLVGVRRDTIARQWLQGSFTDFLDGINYIYSYASSVGKPCVINISWGSQSGPHDGSTLFNEACNNLTGKGRILVMSAGNDGEEKIHMSKTFSSTDTAINTFLTFSSDVYKRTWIDIWGEAGKTFCGKVTLYSKNTPGNTTEFICLDDNDHKKTLVSANGKDTCYVEFINSTAEFNGKPRMTIDVYSRTSDSVCITLKSNNGVINAWNEYYYYGYTYGYQCIFDDLDQSWASEGNITTTVSDMGAADSVILIGAYASKVNFVDINANSWSYSGYVKANRLVPFSSRGPMIDGRIKPDITAPGLTIATSVSSYDTGYTEKGKNSTGTVLACNDHGKKFYYAEFSGTSASGPAASGIVALMLQVNPWLNPGRIKNILFSTAIVDPYTGAIPFSGNNDWGHGKINAYGAMRMTVDRASGILPVTSGTLACDIFPNPTDGAFTIALDASLAGNAQVEVFNLLGSVLYTDEVQVTEGANMLPMDISSLPPGVYFVKVAVGQTYFTTRIVLQ